MNFLRSDESLYDSKEQCDRHEWFRIWFACAVTCYIFAGAFGACLGGFMWKWFYTAEEWSGPINPAQWPSWNFTVLHESIMLGSLFMILACRKLAQEIDAKT